jgi:hypothetical protein
MMETWAIVTLVLGSSLISALLTFFITKVQVRHSDRRFERELERAREAESRQRRWVVRSEPLLKLRNELAHMATKQDEVVAAAHRLHTRLGITEEEAKKELQEKVDDINIYLASGQFMQTVLMQYDKELVDEVDKIIKDYRSSYIDAIYYKELKAAELGKAMEVLGRNKTRIIEVQELINKRLEEL